jgi:hypothetical protein
MRTALFEFRRCVAINGIYVTPENPDLMDRALIIRLSQIPDVKRKEEKIILTEFDEMRPKILGVMFDALSAAMKIHPTIDAKGLPRMADFATWGEAVARARGYEPGAFLRAYDNILGHQVLDVLEENPVGKAVTYFMEDKRTWQGKPTELLGLLELEAEEHTLDTRTQKWPKNAVWLTRRLRAIENSLKKRGIEIDFGISGERVITVENKASGGSGEDSKDDKDGISTTFDNKANPDGSTPQGSENTVDTVPTGLQETRKIGPRTQGIIAHVKKHNNLTEDNWKILFFELGLPESKTGVIFRRLTEERYLASFNWLGTIYWKWTDKR